MNKLKKTIASLLALILILSLSASYSFASIAHDVKNTKYKTQAQVLGALEIMVGDEGTGNFRPDDSIKRSEATKIGVALLGLSASANASSSVSKYPDVGTDYWANGFINTATAYGIVIGDDTGLFRPEDKIKFSEVATILVRALGYESQAKAKGGFPTGYITTATSIGLTKGVNLNSDSYIKRGEVAIMAYNALTINLMEQTGFGTNTKFEVTDKTILKDKLDVTLIQGKVQAVGASVIDGGSALGRNEVRIADKNYNAGKTDTRTILGFNAEAYFSNKAKQIIAIIPTENNNVLSISAQQVASVDTSSAKAINYYKDINAGQKTTKANVESNAYIIYNGKISDFSKFTQINSGYFSLLDTNSNGKYDIVFVNETENYVIEDVYTSSSKITDIYGKSPLKLDFEDENKTIILEKNNEYISLKDLKKWDVVTFTISEDGDIIYGNVVTSPISGKITEIGEDHVYIGNTRYQVASNYPHNISINDEGIFYLDYEGKIAAFDGVKSTSSNYAYIENIGLSTGLNQTLKVELFTSEGKFETLEASSVISVNSSKKLTPEQALNAIGTRGQLITYEKDTEGKLKKVYTSTETDEINENIFTLNINETDVVYRASSSKLTGEKLNVSIANDTVIFDIPENGNKTNYAVRNKNIFTDGGLYDVMVFDVSETYKAGAVIVKNHTSTADESSDIVVVEKINTSVNNDGETIHKLYGYSAGKTISINSKNDTVFKKQGERLLKEGDIIQIRTNADGNADAINVLFDTETDNNEFKKVISDKTTVLYGKVVKTFADSVNIKVGNASPENYAVSSATVYVYDKSLNKNRITVGDISDIDRYENDGGMIFMRLYKDDVKDIVIIKK